MIFYETQAPDINCTSLLSEIISDDLIVRVTQNTTNFNNDSMENGSFIKEELNDEVMDTNDHE